ncbi:MAG TPA: hypothetical protein VL547_08770 [Dinghuibacter sp.]|jgi:hypothetical protein|uniref:hypothetical protein n=1 Tax=Dinghuibacter sp. TaxID=2024697 RepID=UPI002BEC8E6C|nr:hypothetical protein [Dinghuibacter sp.]HTJ12105.1 hypothetical protein [Dinghuibacter sp.]
MKPFLILFAVLAAPRLLNAQTFEGKVVYQLTYTSKLKGLSNDRLANAMGDRSEYYIKGGDYKTVSNGTIFQWQLYRNHENRIYNKTLKSNALLFAEGASNTDTVYNTSLVFGAVTILGHSCDEVVLNCRSGVQQYYFSPSFGVDSELFRLHRYGNYYEYISRAHAIPLKYVVDTPQFIVEATAVQVTPMTLDASFFALPQGVLLQPMPQN